MPNQWTILQRRTEEPSLAAEAERLRRLNPAGTAEPKVTLAAAAAEVVDAAAGRLLWREGFRRDGKPATDRILLRNHLWGTVEGRKLSELAQSRWGHLEVGKAKAAIAADPKAATYFKRHLALLARGHFADEGPA